MIDRTTETIETIETMARQFANYAAVGDPDRAEGWAEIAFILAAMLPEPEEAR